MEKQKRFALAVFLRILLNVSRYAIMISGGLFFIGMLIALITSPADYPLPLSIRFNLDSSLHQIHAVASGVHQGTVEAASGVLNITYSGRGWIAVGMLLLLVVIGEAWIVLHNLWRIMQTVTKGMPFVRENARRLRIIGIAIIAFELLLTLAGYFTRQWVAASFIIDGVTLRQSFDVDYDTIVAGLLILVLSEVFRHGTNLEEDQSLTV